MDSIRVVVADDHPIFREGLAYFLRNTRGIDCVGVANNGKEAIKLAQKLQPNVVILDIDMPKINGIEAAREIKKTCSNTAVLMLTAYKYNDYIIASIQAGVDGYLLKDTSRSELIEAIRMIHSGKGVFNLEATSEILQQIAATSDSDIKLGVAELYAREQEVLKLVARGMSNKQISHKLNISENTVATHLTNIFRKLEVQSRTEAAVYALKEGLITIDDIVEK